MFAGNTAVTASHTLGYAVLVRAFTSHKVDGFACFALVQSFVFMLNKPTAISTDEWIHKSPFMVRNEIRL
jgi:hypothetical protein